MLELAIWKSKITEQSNGQNSDHLLIASLKKNTNSISRTQCHTDSFTAVVIIVPNVFSILTGGSGCHDIVGDNDDNAGHICNYTIDDDNSYSDDSGEYDNHDSDHGENNR